MLEDFPEFVVVLELEGEGADDDVVSFHLLVEGVHGLEELDQKNCLVLLDCGDFLFGIPEMG